MTPLTGHSQKDTTIVTKNKSVAARGYGVGGKV